MPRAARAVETIIPYVDVVPRRFDVGGVEILIRSMNGADIERMLDLGRSLSDREILLLRMNLCRRRSIEEWVADIERGRRLTLIAELEGAILGYAGLSLRGLRWYRHLGDVRLVVHPDFRSRGFGSVLAAELIEISKRLGLQRLIAQVPRAQEQACGFFARFDFQQQVVLPDWVMDGEGKTQDLCLMTLDLR